MQNIMDVMYSSESDQSAFLDAWCGPDIYPHAEWCKVATFTADDGSDGQTVEVFACALPATFYRADVLANKNSVGTYQPAYSVNTGSGQSQLIADIAEAICSGMLGFKQQERTA